MRGRLHPTLTPLSGETPASFASRLAALHGTHAAEFCRDMGLDFQAVGRGRTESVVRLAALAGADPAGLLSNAVRASGVNRYELKGEVLSKSIMVRTRIMACPLCLAQDVAGAGHLRPACAAYGRAIWTLAPILACPEHGTLIVEIGRAADGSQVGDFATVAANRLRDLPGLVASARKCPPSDLEDYLLGRLAGRQGASPWLDALDWHTAADVCQMLGLAAIHDRDQPIGTLSALDWHAAGDAGFAVASEGADTICALLRALDDSYTRHRMSSEGPQAIFGQLFRWIAASPERCDLDPLRTVIRDYVQHHHPVGPSDAIFGRAFTRRVLHSIRSASLEYGIHPKRLRKVLTSKGVIDQNSADLTDERTTFDAEAHRELLEQMVECKSLPEVEAYIDCGRVHARILLENGFIQPLIPGGRGKADFAFTRHELDGFMEKLSARAVEVAETDGAYDIPAAAKRANCGAAEILQAILDGRLGWVGRLAGRNGYMSIRIRLSEVKRLVHGERPAGITANEAEKELKATTKTVVALIKVGLLETFETTNPINRCPLVLITLCSIADFRAKYVSLFQLAAERAVHPRRLKADLAREGCAPDLHPDEFFASFYLKSRVSRA